MTVLPLFDLGRSPALKAAVEDLARAEAGDRGAVFTRRQLVDFVLDLIGYTSDEPLAGSRLIEPSFGAGDFLLPAVSRLIESWTASGRREDLTSAVLAVELHRPTFEQTRSNLLSLLCDLDVAPQTAEMLTEAWLRNDDFLLTDLDAAADFVVGNPPYVRPERIPAALLKEYRRRFKTMYDRADLYVPFIERSLDQLADGGTLAFVCANRWHKNKYGGPLRAKVAEGFNLAYHVDLVGTNAFDRDVIAYPAVTVIRRSDERRTVIATRPEIDASALTSLRQSMLAPESSDPRVEVATQVASGRSPWLLSCPRKLALLRRLEARFPVLEGAGCTVGIGVATGRDRAFIAPFETLDVEPERKLPLVKAPDLRTGTLEWGGLGLVNPYDCSGQLVDIDEWPRFAAYLRRHEAELRARHVARRNQELWYRTIDRVVPGLLSTPKLLIPDIKAEPNVVLDEGRYYPHHNLYWVTSEAWDLRALQRVLNSSLAKMVVASYSVEMAGGFLRFQAQYLRRIPLPVWSTVDDQLREALSRPVLGDAEFEFDLIARLYGLEVDDRAALLGEEG